MADELDARMNASLKSIGESIDRLKAANAALAEALQPFAAVAGEYDETGPDAWADNDDCADIHFTVGQLRAAARAFAQTVQP